MKSETVLKVAVGAFLAGVALSASRAEKRGEERGYLAGYQEGVRDRLEMRVARPEGRSSGRTLGMRQYPPAPEPITRLEDFPVDEITRCPPGVAGFGALDV